MNLVYIIYWIYAILILKAHSLEESIGAKDVGNTMETGQKEQLYYRTAKNSCQKYVFGRMYDCSNEGEQQSHLMKYAKECKNYTAGEPTIIVVDGSGRLGNQIWNYVFMLAVKLKYGYSVYAARHCHDILAPFFKNLTIPIAEDHLCGFDDVQNSYRIHEYEYKITRLQNMIEEEAGFPVSLERAPNGAIIVPPELFQKIPNIRQLVHISEFRDEVEEYTFPNTTYPWEFFRGSFEELGDKSYHKNRVLISEEREIDDSLFESSLVTELSKVVDRTLVFKDDLIEDARKTLSRIANQYKMQQDMLKKKISKTTKKKNSSATEKEGSSSTNAKSNRSKNKKERNIVFVGVHSRRGDHIEHEKATNNNIVDENYFIEAMEMYREKYKDVVFVYISDDLEWGKRMIKKKAERRNINIYFVGDEKETEERSRDRNSIGHDLALMSLCNHTIISHGTYSYWSGYFSAGSVIRPEHFAKYRRYGVRPRNLYNKNPLKYPLPRIYDP